MKHLTFICCSIILLISCKKNNSVELTSDVPNEFRTDINIYYNATLNTTTVHASFSTQTNEYESPQPLQLPTNSYININGTQMPWQPNNYQYEFNGKPICAIEFKDHDETIYNNTIIAPDTAFFIDLPDTVSSLENFDFEVNTLALADNESNRICLDAHGDDYGCIYFGTDNLITLDRQFLTTESSHILFLYRTKTLQNPNLPLGGGGIVYHYVVEKSFYAE